MNDAVTFITQCQFSMKGGYTVADFEKSFVPFQHCSVYYDCGEINIVINKACNAWMVNAT